MTVPARALRRSIAGHLCLLLAALRHRFAWGEGHELLGVELSTWLGLLEGTLLVAFAVLAGGAYVALLRAAPRDAGAVWRGGLLLTALAFAAPPFLSSDVQDYVARGRVEAAYGANPYVTPPAAYPDDPLVAAADPDLRPQWPGFVMPYGPIAALAQLAVATIAGPSMWLGVYLFKLLFAACHLATGWCISRAVASRAPAMAPRALAAWLWNPFLLLESAGSAHNEALMALFLGATALALGRDRFAHGGMHFGLALLTKHGSVAIAPLLAMLAWRRGRLIALVLGGLGAALVAAPLAVHYFATPGGLDFLAKQTGNRGTSAQHFLVLAFGPSAQQPLVLAGFALAGGVILWQARRVRDAASLAHAAAVATLMFLLVAMPLFSPWYHLWWLPVTLACGGVASRATEASLRALAVLGPLSYLIFATTRSFALDHQVWQWATALVAPALVFWRASASAAHESR